MTSGNWQSKTRKSAGGLTLICLALFWIGCTTKTITKTEHVYVTPPPAYTQKYPVPEMDGKKNRDLLIWALDLRELARKHNQDKQALQQWTKGVEKK